MPFDLSRFLFVFTFERAWLSDLLLNTEGHWLQGKRLMMPRSALNSKKG
jgi:hypothetical protein